MKKPGSLLFFLFIITVVSVSVMSGSGCANIVPPGGGPRDSLPPMLMSVKPADSSRSFTSKRIVFEFDEFVELDNLQDNLLVSPLPKIAPTIESRLRTVTVTIKDTLEPSTTYSINFGNAIKDINEGNPLRDFTYIFTTGKTLDSLQVAGKVIIAESGQPDSTLIVMLHTSDDDSVVIKKTPRYITRLDKSGNFTFHNLPAGTFYLYALKDEGGQRKYMSFDQFFAFADSAVTPQLTPKPVTLYAYKEKDTATEKPAAPVAPARPAAGSKNKDGSITQDRRLRVETNLSGSALDLLDSLKLRFPVKLKYFDSTKITFTNEKYEPISNYTLLQDTGNTQVTLVYKWTANTPYNLILDTAFAEDTMGRKLLRKDTLEFRTKKESDYGLVRLRFLNLHLSKNPVLQFVQSDQVKYSHVFTARDFNSKLFIPGDYDLRILYDENKNGIWDPGEFFGKHKQPEKVQPITRKLTVKANWDNEVDITL